MTTADRANERGFTLFELIISTAVLLGVLIASGNLFVTAATTQQTLGTRDLLEENLRRAMERIVNRVREAGLDTLVDVPDAPAVSSSVRFRRLQDYDVSRGSVFGPEERFWFRAPPGGVLVGEGEGTIAPVQAGTLMFDAGGSSVSWSDDLTSVAFGRTERGLEIALEARIMGPQGSTIVVRRRTHVALRN
jgi:hypothetical protein